MKSVRGKKVTKSFDFVDEFFPLKGKDNQGKTWLDPMLYNVGIYLITPILLGLVLGIYLDNRLGTKPLMILFFLILGVISSFYNFWKIAKK